MAHTEVIPGPPGVFGPLSRAELAAVEVALRRFVLSRTGDPHAADDIVQESLTRVLAAAASLEIETLTGYAIAVARNEITSRARAETTARLHLPRLLDRSVPPTPDEVVTAKESQAALAAALAALPERTRRLLVAHDLHGRPLAEIASQEKVRPGALAARLHRTRAQLRVDYVVALRGATLPDSRCRPVLLSISACDTRQQRALNAGQHLTGCTVCDEVAVPLLTRDRTLAGVVPWLALGTPHGVISAWVGRHPRTATTTAAAAATAAALVLGATMVTAAHRSPTHEGPPAMPRIAASASAAPTSPTAAAAESREPHRVREERRDPRRLSRT